MIRDVTGAAWQRRITISIASDCASAWADTLVAWVDSVKLRSSTDL